MTSDTSLYGTRKPKTTPKELSSSTSLAFSSTLSSLLSTSTPSTTAGRPRPSKANKNDIFTSHNKNTKKRAARDLDEDPDDARQQRRQDIGSVDEALLHRSKKKLAAKAKLYKEMKRSDYAGDEGDALVDFDRKWAERQGSRQGQGKANGELSSSSEDEGPAPGEEIVDYEDEYGRLRRGPKSEAERMERRKRNQTLGQEELDRISARPAQPSKLIYGDTVQTLAFNPDEDKSVKMEELARKRDRSMTPPEMKHYEADKEYRVKGVGFYAFSKDEESRKREMEELGREREATERMRKERELKKEERRRELEERRRVLGEKRAKKQADAFLEGLSADLGGGPGSN
ncbi:Coiled-coil domain-containing protein [Lachnellula willkommii]|uniref:Coiled-coil domain-containing protein n=1 Tax=Lachnellula willkommii TaxID=215461 RepID=A0A559MJZ4_9HELO|nr:Coiled-coil domain-containing protein [Lachnellula willkommii]